jgi:alkanesulfonate monooxygenase SsuD/methylene tetrahydromethanopterin reductase-like flavin-dependent oxidoreductase (luciferase family)
MKFSVWPITNRSWTELVEFAVYAESHDWHGIWYADHFMPDSPDGVAKDGPLFECWSVLTGLAAKTERLRLGSLVSPTTFHHPALLANRAATVDAISNGRLILGLGAGWQVNEHAAYGVNLLSPKARVDASKRPFRSSVRY